MHRLVAGIVAVRYPLSHVWRQHRTWVTTSPILRSQGPALMARYERMVSSGTLMSDSQQRAAMVSLDNILKELVLHYDVMDKHHRSMDQWDREASEIEATVRAELENLIAEGKESGLTGRWKRFKTRKIQTPEEKEWWIKRELETRLPPKPEPPDTPKGAYIYGEVGSGKSMCMDLFFHSASSLPMPSRRVHFNAFMLELHKQMHRYSIERPDLKDTEDIMKGVIPHVVSEIMLIPPQFDRHRRSLQLMCLDEFQVNDICNAMLLRSVFQLMMEHGTVVILTCNRPVDNLNIIGSNHAYFAAFTQHLQQCSPPICISAGIDYRTELSHDERLFFSPNNDDSRASVSSLMERILRTEEGLSSADLKPLNVPVMFGRSLEISRVAGGVAVVDFNDLCSTYLGSPDFIAIAAKFHTLIMFGVPQMSLQSRDKARRFITLIDELYNHKVRFICVADVDVDNLFSGTEEAQVDLEGTQFETEVEESKSRFDLTQVAEVAPFARSKDSRKGTLFTGEDERFAFSRAISRLKEMGSTVYLSTRERPSAG